jgi:hypothetical protein
MDIKEMAPAASKPSPYKRNMPSPEKDIGWPSFQQQLALATQEDDNSIPLPPPPSPLRNDKN